MSLCALPSVPAAAACQVCAVTYVMCVDVFVRACVQYSHPDKQSVRFGASVPLVLFCVSGVQKNT